MAQHRGVAEWFSLGFEHSAEVFCCHDSEPQAHDSLSQIKSVSAAESVPAHPPTDKEFTAGND